MSAPEAPNLLPCPFCGGSDIRVSEQDDITGGDARWWMIVCETKGCTVHPFTGGRILSLAGLRWNRRAQAGAA